MSCTHLFYVCRCAHCPLTRHLQKKLSGHPNIVQFCSAASIGKEESDTGQAEFLLLTELCKGNVPLGQPLTLPAAPKALLWGTRAAAAWAPEGM